MKNGEIVTSKEEIQDKELVERIKKGNEEAFDILIKRYYNMVYFTCIKKLYNPDIAKEATQEVFIKVWKSINTCADGTYFISWIMTIARNHCIDILRKEKNRKEREISIETFENSDNISPNASDSSIIDKSIEYEYLNILVEQLPESQRIVFQKRLEGWSVQEIADELNCPLGTVLSRFSLAKRKIYEQMKKMNISLKEL